MRSRYSDTARLIEFALELAGRMAGVVGDAIPEDAKRHLNNAQRELFTALFLIYRHQAMGRREGFEAAVRARAEPAPAPRRRSRAGAGSRPKTRTTRIDIS